MRIQPADVTDYQSYMTLILRKQLWNPLKAAKIDRLLGIGITAPPPKDGEHHPLIGLLFIFVKAA